MARGLQAFPSTAFAAILAIALAGCGDPAPGPTSTRPPVPDGWTTIVVTSGDLRMDLPPWLVPFDTQAALFANEPPEPGVDGFMQLLAEGPRSAHPQPGPGESLERWLEARLDPAGPGPGTSRRIDLPIGSGVVVERIISPDSPMAWRVEAYAIQTPFGVAYLLIDGPVAHWVGREADIRLIPTLMQVGPG